MKVYFLVFLLLLSLFCSYTNCKLHVVSPQSTKDSLPKGIDYQTTRFGRIPYGSRFTGTLFSTSDLCSPVKSDAFLLEKVPILITSDSGCKYTVKAMHAQLVGAKMLIIKEEFNELPKNPIGHNSGANILIPTIIIPRDSGAKLFADLKKESKIILTMTFPPEPKDDKILLQYFFSSADTTNTAFKFIKEFKDFYFQAQEAFDFEPHYITWSYVPDKPKNIEITYDDCLSSGRYCSPDPDHEGPLQGADVVMENLKQICIWRTAPNGWWDYMEKFEKCRNNENQKFCSDLVLQDIGLDRNGLSSVKNCIESSFRGLGSDKKTIDNFILKEEKQIQEDYEISTFPTLFIDYQHYSGNLERSKEVMQYVCEESQNPPKICSKYSIVVYNLQKEVELRNNLIIFAIMMFIIIILILLFYRHVSKKEMNKNMSIEISHAVSQYFTLNEESKSINDST